MTYENLSQYQNRIEQFLEHYLDKLPNYSEQLDSAIRYSALNQGKRIRPAIVLAIGEALDIPEKQLKAPVCALELVHCYSLVHDDLPAMDDDDLRRGKPTCHIAFNEATAILVGDAQQTLAFQILSEAEEIQAEYRLRMIQLLARASGVFGMISGQQIDMENEGQSIVLSQLKQMHRLKTGALLETALLLGACQSRNYETMKPLLIQLGKNIGLAFQVQDDILDIESATEILGKTQGKDLKADKATYPKLLGLDEAKSYRDQLIFEAKEKLAALPFKSEFLEGLIDFIAARRH